jgi:site-specific DNA-adenine methylase
MSTLKYSGSKDKATENLPSHSDQQSKQSVLPPFSGELSVDKELKIETREY